MSKEQREKLKAYMEADYLPVGQPPAAEYRVGNALDYTAYQLGQISKKLDRLIEVLEKRDGN